MQRKRQLRCLGSAKHIALPLARYLASSYRIGMTGWNNGTESQDEEVTLDGRWRKSFPDLQSVSLLLDPLSVSFKKDGTLRLYEAEEKPILSVRRLRPSDVIQTFTAKFSYRNSKPDVNLYILTRKPPTPSIGL